MNREDHINIARVLNEYSCKLPNGLMFDLCVMLRQDNKQFNAELFTEAVYGEKE